MLLSHSRLFAPDQVDHRIFVKSGGTTAPAPLFAPPPAADHGPRPADLRDLGFDATPTPQLLVDADGVLQAANRRARATFGLSARDQGRLLRDLEISYRPVELRSPIERAFTEGRTVEVPGVERVFPDGETAWYDLVVAPLRNGGGDPLGVAVSFVDVTEIRDLQHELERSKEELQTANEELQSTNEELETTNEELQSTNEELETTNEELQSTNEELETMNEELHSTNEQLEAVNDQLRDRSGELDRANSFMQAVLASLSVAVVVLDTSWVVRVWNEAAEDLWGLSADRVVGRSFFALDMGLPVDELRTPLQACFEAGAASEQLTLPATDRRGQSLRCRVTCTPLNDVEADGEEGPGAVLLMEPQP